MTFHLTPLSSNAKTGLGVAVSTSDAKTCPDSCPLKGKGCYAASGPLAIHWRKVSDEGRGDNWENFLAKVNGLNKGYKFRHNQAGDLPGENEEINPVMLDQLATVVKNRKLQAWSYTHKPLNAPNVEAFKGAIDKGLVINASADSLKEADEARALGLPTVVVLAQDAPMTSYTPQGNKVVVCPAQRAGNAATCATCMLCNKADRTVIIGFQAHGTSKAKVTKMVKAMA